METISLENIYSELMDLKKQVSEIKIVIEDLDIADELEAEIKDSQKRPLEQFISNKEMGKEFK